MKTTDQLYDAADVALANSMKAKKLGDDEAAAEFRRRARQLMRRAKKLN